MTEKNHLEVLVPSNAPRHSYTKFTYVNYVVEVERINEEFSVTLSWLIYTKTVKLAREKVLRYIYLNTYRKGTNANNAKTAVKKIAQYFELQLPYIITGEKQC